MNICGEEKNESSSKKLLGVVVNNTATFKNHLYIYGDEENQGLLKQLSTRVGMLKKINEYMPFARLKQLMEGMLSSKLMYGMTFWGRMWQIPGSMDEDGKSRMSPSIAKEAPVPPKQVSVCCYRL